MALEGINQTRIVTSRSVSKGDFSTVSLLRLKLAIDLNVSFQ